MWFNFSKICFVIFFEHTLFFVLWFSHYWEWDDSDWVALNSLILVSLWSTSCGTTALSVVVKICGSSKSVLVLINVPALLARSADEKLSLRVLRREHRSRGGTCLLPRSMLGRAVRITHLWWASLRVQLWHTARREQTWAFLGIVMRLRFLLLGAETLVHDHWRVVVIVLRIRRLDLTHID